MESIITEAIVSTQANLRHPKQDWAAHWRRNVCISALIFVAAATLAHHAQIFDIPLTRFVNSYAGRSAFADTVLHAFDTSFTFSGVILMAFISSAWFGTTEADHRARILTGTLASIGAGAISRILQRTLPSHPRPMYDPALGFHMPPIFGGRFLNTWNSFPSDHVCVFAGLSIVIFFTHSRWRWFAIIWLVLVEPSRTYAGAHYPSDLIGGAALAGVVVWLTQAPSVVAKTHPVLKWEERSPKTFYFVAFFVAYQIATLFVDLRSLSRM